MYCRSCHYDLRGQLDPRCPECGTQFQFDSPATYLTGVRTTAGWVLLILRNVGLYSLRLVLIALVALGPLAFPSLTHCGRYPFWIFTNANLTDIVTQWKRQCKNSVIDCPFDYVLAAREMKPHMSPSRDQDQRCRFVGWEYSISDSAPGFFVSGVFAALLAITFAGRPRRYILALALSTFLVGVICICCAHRIAGWRYPGSHAFLDDFVYLDPPFPGYVDHTGKQHLLIAYQAQPEHRDIRAVAMASGLVTHAWDEVLEQHLNCANLSLYPRD